MKIKEIINDKVFFFFMYRSIKNPTCDSTRIFFPPNLFSQIQHQYGSRIILFTSFLQTFLPTILSILTFVLTLYILTFFSFFQARDTSLDVLPPLLLSSSLTVSKSLLSALRLLTSLVSSSAPS